MLNFLFPRFMETVHIAQDIVFLPSRIQPPKNIDNIWQIELDEIMVVFTLGC